MGIVIDRSVFDRHLNKRTLWDNGRPTVPLDPADFGQVLQYGKHPGRALIERPAFAVDIQREELDLRGSHRGALNAEIPPDDDQFNFRKMESPSAYDPNDCTS